MPVLNCSILRASLVTAWFWQVALRDLESGRDAAPLRAELLIEQLFAASSLRMCGFCDTDDQLAVLVATGSQCRL